MARFALGILFTLIVMYILNTFYNMGRKDEKKETDSAVTEKVRRGGEKSEQK